MSAYRTKIKKSLQPTFIFEYNVGSLIRRAAMRNYKTEVPPQIDDNLALAIGYLFVALVIVMNIFEITV
jgi:hypothetical protein